MIIDCIADLHGDYPRLGGGDVLIVAGDLTAADREWQYLEFRNWLIAQKYANKILVPGNHDRCIEDGRFYFDPDWLGAHYLFDSGVEIDGIKFWGSPWTPYFDGVNHHCTAFMKPDKRLKKHWDEIPEDTDILITHGPPRGTLDKNRHGNHCGSESLSKSLSEKKIRYHVFGHIHESYGMSNPGDEYDKETPDGIFDREYPWGHCSINCSFVNGDYESVNQPIRIVL